VSPSGGAPRVRFAPSPTGYFHVGGARTALYNWLFARRLGGTFVLRIEDTDRERSNPAWIDGILGALGWLGIIWDEGPYFQTDRLALHAAAAERLAAGGFAYACDCAPDLVRERTRGNPVPGYDGFCRDRGLEPAPGRALRFRVPDDGVTVVHDVVRGDVEFPNSSIEDFVIVKSNGDPLFVLAGVVDDVDMGITHVIRGEEHLPTTPKAILIWQALGGPELPVYAHLPVLVNEKRQKLSKRRDRVAVEDYRALGYLPEAMVNYLALVGWSPGEDREVLTLEELIEEFRLEDVSHSPGFFDEQRLAHFNGLYIRRLTPEEFLGRAEPFVRSPGAPWPEERFDQAVFEHLAPLAQERIAVLSEIPAMVEFAFDDPFVADEAAFDKAIRRDELARAILDAAVEALERCPWEADALKDAIAGIADALGRKLAKAQAPIRVATMGRTVGLPLFQSLEVLGRERSLERLRAALAALGSGPAGQGGQ